MSLLDLIYNKNKDNEEGIGKVATEAAVDIIKKLSGSDIKRTKKVIDNIVTVTNASGGAGASTIASNIAYIASKKGFNVLLIDLNIMYPIQHSYFRAKPDIEKPDLVGYLLGKNTLGESIESVGSISLMYANNRGLVDSINSESDIAINNFTQALIKLRQLFDLIVIDAPMAIDHTLVNTAFYYSDKIYLVWDEGLGPISNTERIRRNMASSGIDTYSKMKVILNKRTSVSYTNYPFEKLNIELVQTLPFDISIIDSSLKATIFCNSGTSSEETANVFYKGIVSLTDRILEDGGYINNGPKKIIGDTDTERG